MSPNKVTNKLNLLSNFIHQSQKDSVPFQGTDSREFWQRSEARNTDTAKTYNALGFTEYYAIEAFRRYHF